MVGMSSDGIMFIPNVMKSGLLLQKQKGGGGHIHGQHSDLISILCPFKEAIYTKNQPLISICYCTQMHFKY